MLFVDRDLARRIERAECQLSCAIVNVMLARADDAFALPLGGGAACYTGAASPMNKVIGIGFEPVAEAEWDAVERQFAEKRCAVRVELSTLSDKTIAQALTRRGYVLEEFENVLAFDLAGAPLPAPPDTQGLAVTREDGNPLAWMDVVIDGFRHPDGSPQSSESFPDEALRQVYADFAASPGFVRYLALLDDVAAGGGALRIDGDIAQLCGASTLPRFRRRGIQTGLLRRRLADARAQGCVLATVTTQPGSKSNQNAQRQGFELLYPRAVLVKHVTT
jgi:ribosomal protein S18 acetylase RimI-like enzyme